MILLILSLIGLVNAKPSIMMDSLCSIYENKDDCLNNWDCMWCNNTLTNNTGTCNKFNVCNFNSSSFENCETPNYFFTNECNFLTLLFYTVIITSFLASVCLLLHTNQRLLTKQNTSYRAINHIQYLLLFLIVIPFFILFYFDNRFFYYYLISIIFFSLLYSCCFHTSNYTKQNYQRWMIDYYKIHNPHDNNIETEREKLIN